jgi:hypothetical protein
MEQRAGGNARWGENEVSAYPWAAHYVPVPGPRATLVRELFTELGLLRDGQWDERQLCYSPQERLFMHGEWRPGLEPDYSSGVRARDELRRFAGRMDELRATGEFTIPMVDGARPSPLDQISMREWMRREGFRSPALEWYIDYACRDDYGATAEHTSAWAGVHYFAAREPDEQGPLTWPEGNGWILRRLLERVGDHVTTGAPVQRVERRGRALRVLAGDVEYRCDAVIFAAPSFLAPYVVDGEQARVPFEYSPWLTANLTLDRWPAERGIEPAWDNVIYDSPALGYVVATHQTLRTRVDRTVWTYYWALAQSSPADGRRALLAADWRTWSERILTDLERAHPDIRQCVSRIDIMRLGHAMIRPTPGFLSSPERARFAHSSGPIWYAHSDLSGLSLFEEAQYRGVTAADAALRMLGGA